MVSSVSVPYFRIFHIRTSQLSDTTDLTNATSSDVMDLGSRDIMNPFIYNFHTIMLGTYDTLDMCGIHSIHGTHHQSDQTLDHKVYNSNFPFSEKNTTQCND